MTPRRRRSLHGVATWRGVVRHGRALVPRAVGRTVRSARARGCGRARAARAALVRACADRPRRLPPPPARGTGRTASPACDAHRSGRGARPRLGDDAPDRGAARGRPELRPARGGSAEPDVPAGRLPVQAPRGAGRAGEGCSPARRWECARGRRGGGADRVASGDVRRRAVLRSPRGRHATPRRGARLGHVESRDGQQPEPPGTALRQRADDPRHRLGPRRLPRLPPGRAASGDRRHQPAPRRLDGRARLAPERARRGRVLPAARPPPERPHRVEPGRPPPRPGASRPLPRRRCAHRLRRLLLGPPGPGRGRRSPSWNGVSTSEPDRTRIAAQPSGSAKRTCMWFSWFAYGTTTPPGPRRPDE